jgi:hypothetical protein
MSTRIFSLIASTTPKRTLVRQQFKIPSEAFALVVRGRLCRHHAVHAVDTGLFGGDADFDSTVSNASLVVVRQVNDQDKASNNRLQHGPR